MSTFCSRNGIALSGVCLASLMFGLEISSVPVILPTLEQVLEANFNGLQWIMNAYTIAVTTVLMATGALADRYGRKRMFVGSVVAFGVTSVACGLAASTPELIVARLLQGGSGGAMLICQVAVLSHQFKDASERGAAFSTWGIVFGFGLGFGPIIGGGIVAASSWQWVFLIHGLLALATLPLVIGGVQESRDPGAEKLDVVGVATLALSVFCLAFFITQGPTFGFGNPIVIGTAAITVVSFVAFVIAEYFNQRPMFDFAVFRIRSFSGALLGSMGMNFSFWPFIIYLPIYVRGGLGYDAVTAGLVMLAYTVPTLVIPPLAERLSLRYWPGLIIPAGLFTIGLGFFLMRVGNGVTHPSWATMLPGALVAGMGLGLTNTPVTNTTTGSVPSAHAGMASGIDMSARMISLAVNIALMGSILVSGVLACILDAVPGYPAASSLRPVAERIAAGDLMALDRLLPSLSATETAIVARAALTQGFGWVLVYGGLSAWLMAMASLLVFGRKPVFVGQCSSSRSLDA